MMPKDFWIGSVGLGFAAIYWFEAGKIRISPLDDPVTAAGLPKALGIVFGVLAIVMIVRGLLEFAGRRPAVSGGITDQPKPGERMRPHLRAAGVLAIGVAYLLLIPYVGYALGIMALMLAISMYIGAPLGVRSVMTAVLGGIFFHLLFVELLGIPLPEGALIETLLGSKS
ncbi:MAG TPA: tripartite tricarboxylate transporter TctB family protein [Thermohalobaculum sp.]|nr:tripartite tricarboxylate transporter TctB family protein [Thermohalobaculum sp.]